MAGMRCVISQALIVWLGFALAGCATQAQRQALAIKENNTNANLQYSACARSLYSSAEADPIRSHTPMNATDATLAQLADSSMASPSEIQAILSVQPRLKECQRTALTQLSTSTPSLVPILAKSYSALDDNFLSLVQRRITWGEFNKRRRDSAAGTQLALQQAGRQIAGELREMHRDEMAQRQAAAEAFAQWAQTQQLINAMNRPVITNCNRFGSNVNCVTQ